MSFFASPPPSAGPVALTLLGYAFLICTLLCFIRVAAYALARQGRGTLVNGPDAPRLAVRGLSGWPFSLCVLLLLFLQSPLYLIVIPVGIIGILIETGRSANQEFGLARLSPGRLVAWVPLVCGAVIFMELPLGQLIDFAMSRLNVPHPEQESVNMFRHLSRASDIAFFLIQAAVIAPLLEEFFFRGFLFDTLPLPGT